MRSLTTHEEEVESVALDLRFKVDYYGIDYPIHELVKRMEEGLLFPDYSRKYEWQHLEASKFIQSLLSSVSVPYLFLSKDKCSEKLTVVDGRQRLRTLQYFYQGFFPGGTPFVLDDDSFPYSGKTYAELLPDDKKKLDNATLPCIVIAENDRPDNVFSILEYPREDEKPLSAEEIRSSLYHGPYKNP